MTASFSCFINFINDIDMKNFYQENIFLRLKLVIFFIIWCVYYFNMTFVAGSGPVQFWYQKWEICERKSAITHTVKSVGCLVSEPLTKKKSRPRVSYLRIKTHRWYSLYVFYVAEKLKGDQYWKATDVMAYSDSCCSLSDTHLSEIMF